MEHEFAYLATVGRRTGRPHVIEIWYVEHDGTYYLMSQGRGRADWVRNIRANPTVTIRLGGPRSRTAEGGGPALARVVPGGPEDERVRRLVAAKYHGWTDGAPLPGWAQTALVVAVSPLARR